MAVYYEPPRNTEIWAVIEDVDTNTILSDQKLFLEVYFIGTVNRNERRYRKFTASKNNAVEFIKASEASQQK